MQPLYLLCSLPASLKTLYPFFPLAFAASLVTVSAKMPKITICSSRRMEPLTPALPLYIFPHQEQREQF